MTDYYSRLLSGERLRRVYEIAPSREIHNVQGRVGRCDWIVELGCGYGRVALRLAEVARSVVGIDLAESRSDRGRDASSFDMVSRASLVQAVPFDWRRMCELIGCGLRTAVRANLSSSVVISTNLYLHTLPQGKAGAKKVVTRRAVS